MSYDFMEMRCPLVSFNALFVLMLPCLAFLSSTVADLHLAVCISIQFIIILQETIIFMQISERTIVKQYC